MPEGLGDTELGAMAKAAAVVALTGQGYPSVEVALDNGQAFLADKDNRVARLVASFEHPVYGGYDQLGAVLSFGDLATPLDLPPPLLGQHSDEVLAEIGFDAAARSALIVAEVVKAA